MSCGLPIPVTAESGEAYRGSNEQPVAGPGLPMPELEKVGYLQEEYFISGTVDGKPVIGYRQEDRVNPRSQTETYAALRL